MRKPEIKKILLTGAAGFIGSHVADLLIKQDMDVMSIDALTYAGNLNNLRGVCENPRHHFVHENICNQNAIKQLVRTYQPDAILHLAAESHVDRSIACADDFVQTNVMGTHRLLDIALAYFQSLDGQRQASFRFLHVSTDEVFGALGPTGVFTEESFYHPNSPYAASKAASDFFVRAYHHTYGLPTLIANASNNYGPRQYPEKLIPLALTRALSHQSIPVYGNGQQSRDWLYVTDHAQALWTLLKKGKIGESYCIGAENELSNLALVEKLCNILDEMKPSCIPYRSLISFVADRLGHDVRYAINATKLRRETGWSPQVPFDEGLKQTVSWYVQSLGYEK